MRPVYWKLARHAGVLAAWRWKNRHSIIILTAHGVMDNGDSVGWRPLWNRLQVEQFERVLRVLQPYYEFVTLSEAARMLRGELPIRPHCMALTFDDGYRNNFTHALPVLERLGIPATFFICTGMIGTRRGFWVDRLDYAIQHMPPRERIVPVGSESVVLCYENREALAASYLKLRLALKQSAGTGFDELVDELACEFEQEAGTSLDDVIDVDPWASCMSWDEVESARRRGIEIGSHTIDHVRLTHVDANSVWNQLAGSRAEIERQLSVECMSVAYPNGDYTVSVAHIACRAGYLCAVTTETGVNRIGDNMLALRRIDFPTVQNSDHILGLVSGLQSAVAQLLSRRTGWR